MSTLDAWAENKTMHPGCRDSHSRSGARLLPRRRPGRILEKFIEGGIYGIAFTAVAVVFLILIFVARESLPVLFQFGNRGNAAEGREAGEASASDPVRAAQFLGMSEKEVRELDAETLRFLIESKTRELGAAPSDPDLRVNPVSYRMMTLPYQWTGYARSGFIWQPESSIPKFNIVPLLLGTLKCTVIALAFSVPLALLAAIYISQMAPLWQRQIVKPLIEMLAGIPSVVLGFIALMLLATWLQNALGYSYRLNAFAAGIALGLAVVPVVFTIAEDALRAVPNSYKEASIALGASRYDTITRVVVPAATPGLFAAVILGFGRAVGETMIVLMASGNASIVSLAPTDSTRTLTATIAAELAEAVRGGLHYQVLFFLGVLLFVLTFASNSIAGLVISSMRRKMTGKS